MIENCEGDRPLRGGFALPYRETLHSPSGRLRAHTSLREVRFSLSRMCLDSTTSHGSSIFTPVKISDDRKSRGGAMAGREIAYPAGMLHDRFARNDGSGAVCWGGKRDLSTSLRKVREDKSK